MLEFICRIMKKFTAVLALLIFTGLQQVKAQTTVVFNLNLKPQLEDSLFVAGRGDIAQLTGNMYPLGRNRFIRLRDEEPIDSVYTAEVTFPRAVRGRRLSYNYLLETENRIFREQMPRHVELTGGEVELDPLYFDSYVW